jgi:hypothetical protein
MRKNHYPGTQECLCLSAETCVLVCLRAAPSTAPSTAAKESAPEAMQEDQPGGAANGVDPSSEKKKKKKVRGLLRRCLAAACVGTLKLLLCSAWGGVCAGISYEAETVPALTLHMIQLLTDLEERGAGIIVDACLGSGHCMANMLS